MSGFNIKGMFDRSQLIVAGIAGGMLVCFVALICVPDARRMGDLESQLRDAEVQRETQQASIEPLPKITKSVAQMKREHGSYAARVPGEPQLPKFLGEVGRILKEESVTQHEIVPRRPVEKGEHTELAVDLRFESSWDKAYRVLARIEYLQRTNHVASLKYMSLADGGDRIRVEMCVTVYYTHVRTDPGAKTASAGGANRG
jgi:Tfp pilus assembly protein PilO